MRVATYSYVYVESLYFSFVGYLFMFFAHFLLIEMSVFSSFTVLVFEFKYLMHCNKWLSRDHMCKKTFD